VITMKRLPRTASKCGDKHLHPDPARSCGSLAICFSGRNQAAARRLFLGSVMPDFPARDTGCFVIFPIRRSMSASADTIFARNWLLLPMKPACSRPAYVAGNDCGHPVLALRDEAGNLRAFHKCLPAPRRPLVGTAAVAAKKCCAGRYHGWSYAFGRQLASARDFGPAAGIRSRQYGPVLASL